MSFQLSPFGYELFQKRYAKKDPISKQPVETKIEQMWERTSDYLARAEKPPHLSVNKPRTVRQIINSSTQLKWRDEFYWLQEDVRFTFGGRILAGAGGNVGDNLANCFVSRIKKDSLESIMDEIKKAATTWKYGGGYGTNLGNLRPYNAPIVSVNGTSPGVPCWMELFSQVCQSISQAGNRRGATMLMLPIYHPDIKRFITLKRDNKNVPQDFQRAMRVTGANLSVLVDDEFLAAVDKNADWDLYYPDVTCPEYADWDGDIKKWKLCGLPVVVYETVKATELMDLIAQCAWESAEPGVVNIDTMNRYNPISYLGGVWACNPCGEYGLIPNESCVLGSINLGRMKEHRSELSRIVHIAVRALDNATELSRYPHPEYEQQQKSTRRIGLGIIGLDSYLKKLGLRYGSVGAVEATTDIMSEIASLAYIASIELAIEKGAFAAFDPLQYNYTFVEEKLSNFVHTFSTGERLTIKQAIQKYGIRNCSVLSVAPTGTIASMVDESTGVEPWFAHEFTRYILTDPVNNIREPRQIKSSIFEWYLQNVDSTATVDNLPSYMATAMDLTVDEHYNMLEAVSYWVDSAVSKTMNMPETATVEDVKRLMLRSLKSGIIKGGTVYREGSLKMAVLERKQESTQEPAVTSFKLAIGEATSGTVVRQPTLNEKGEKKRPRILEGKTYKLKIRGEHASTFYITINDFVDDEGDTRPFEIFISSDTADSGVIALAMTLSALFRREKKLYFLIEKLKRIKSNLFLTYNHKILTSVEAAIGYIIEEHIASYTVETNNVQTITHDFLIDTSITCNKLTNEQTIVRSVQALRVCEQCGEKAVAMVEGCTQCQVCGAGRCG